MAVGVPKRCIGEADAASQKACLATYTWKGGRNHAVICLVVRVLKRCVGKANAGIHRHGLEVFHAEVLGTAQQLAWWWECQTNALVGHRKNASMRGSHEG
eukprot:scaffold138004_cov16-Tisochrysis_lutea.AAC.1